MGRVTVRVICLAVALVCIAPAVHAANSVPTGDQLVGNCGEIAHGPGCSDLACQTCVCAAKPECCAVDWNPDCLSQAASCPGECFAVVGNCGDPRPEPGCSDPICEACVCSYNAIIDLGRCCTDAWTTSCAQFADGILFDDAQCVEECLTANRSQPAPLLSWPGAIGVLIVIAAVARHRLRRVSQV